jgi:hypothetical protein
MTFKTFCFYYLLLLGAIAIVSSFLTWWRHKLTGKYDIIDVEESRPIEKPMGRIKAAFYILFALTGYGIILYIFTL